MTERRTYYCNWCHKDAPTAGVVPPDWLEGVDLDGYTKLHLCETCKVIRRHHLGKAIAEAHVNTRPQDCLECRRLDGEFKKMRAMEVTPGDG